MTGASRSVVFFLTLLAASPAAAQVSGRPPAPQEPYPAVSPRGFVSFSQQKFAADGTFDAVFGESVQPFRGGGVDVVVFRNFFGELSFTRFEQTGERVFRFEGENFPLGIPLTASVQPVEVTGGYRLTEWRRVIPYGGIGFGSYHYKETSGFSTDGENVDVSGDGLVLVAGVEIRLMRWVGLTVDVRKTSINDIIGTAGVSREFSETDLGGTAFRFRVMVGR
jgi:hypothetical protein